MMSLYCGVLQHVDQLARQGIESVGRQCVDLMGEIVV